MRDTDIEWCDDTWNPLLGCERVDATCLNCFAQTHAHRFSKVPASPYFGLTNERGEWTGKIKLQEHHLDVPKRIPGARRIFVPSNSDLFHRNVPDEYIDRVWDVMRDCPQHTFMLLTKRPTRLLTWMRARVERLGEAQAILPNLMLGTSAGTQRGVDERVPPLLEVPAARRFLSIEPLIERVTLRGVLAAGKLANRLHLVIVGGESGHPGKARAFDPAWARVSRDECDDFGIPFFLKQLGRHPLGLKLRDIKGGDIGEWPDDLRIRRFPRVTV